MKNHTNMLALIFSLPCHLFGVSVYDQHLTLQAYTGHNLMGVSDNYEYCSSVLDPNSTYGSFFVVVVVFKT